jgi:predicted DNA-binding antitoxin AbrB/MazE fold protein
MDTGVTSGADDPRRSFSPPHGTIKVVRVVEAQYEDGVLRPTQRLGLRPGEQVSLIVVRRPDPSRWDLARLVKAGNREDLALAEQGLTEWSGELDATERA